MTRRRIPAALPAASIARATKPATGRRDFTLMRLAHEIEVGLGA